jgi:ATP-binding cassette, subfamily B (MDR/TAP), member 1
MMGFNQNARKSYEQAGSIASEAVDNVRTVIAVNQEDAFLNDYHVALEVPTAAASRNAHVSGFAFGFGEGMVFLVWALAFYYGAKTVVWGFATFAEMMRATSALIFSSMMIGQLASFSTDFSKALVAAAEMFAIVDRVPPIDSASTEGQQPALCEGHVRLTGVRFAYPSRPDIAVLRGLDVEVPPGKTVALVGSSGCGKSTVIQLVERFYDPSEGAVMLDGVDVRSLNLTWARAQVGLVGQEPILFATTILENIRYGKPDATQAEVDAAAREANAYDFIMSLPDGYATFVGEKGTQLSGGQKQRIAIARALVRNPKVLLLDEATSALDSESEKIVQAALDRARRGRACLVIAHRLATVQDADNILVLDQGVVVEQGTHNELISRNGLYATLVKNQAMSTI